MTMTSKFCYLLICLMFLSHKVYSQAQAPSLDQSIRVYNREAFARVRTYSDLSYATPFLEHTSPSRFFSRLLLPYILTADLSPNFYIGGEGLPFVFTGTPRFQVRMINDEEGSHPVRTPSYMPGGTVTVPLKRSRLAKPYAPFDAVGVTGFHHSNGQYQEEFINGEINTFDGNFSTNYIELFYLGSVRREFNGPFKFSCPEPNVIMNDLYYPSGYYELYYKVGYEQHFATADDLTRHYNRSRLNFKAGYIKVNNFRLGSGAQTASIIENFTNNGTPAEAGYCYRLETIRIEGTFNLMLDSPPDRDNRFTRKVNASLAIHRRLWGSNTALFAMVGYYGTDIYNIYFLESYAFARVGLSLGNFTSSR